mmetsp:Transcript_3491/g.8131  ORF Transcript_3491/g.8131 Transcript_3491/m.8131 type:complete len:397 (+) Transcript_3491:3491-4681(+)
MCREVGEVHAGRPPRVAHLQRRDHPGAHQLAHHVGAVDDARALVRVGLDAPHEARRGARQRLHQLVEGVGEGGRDCLGLVEQQLGAPLRVEVAHEFARTRAQPVVEVVEELVAVLGHPQRVGALAVPDGADRVHDGPGEVLHHELVGVRPRAVQVAPPRRPAARGVEGVGLVQLVARSGEGRVRRRRPARAVRVEVGQDARGPLHDQVQALLVVREVRHVKVDPLFVVHGQLLLESHVIEHLLEALVREVDQELLEAVRGQVLKAENVEDAEECGVGAGVAVKSSVHARHNFAEQGVEDVLRERVPRGGGGLDVVRGGDALHVPGEVEDVDHEVLRELLRVHPEQRRGRGQHRHVVHPRRVHVAVGQKGHVAQVQHPAQHLKHLELGLVVQVEEAH